MPKKQATYSSRRVSETLRNGDGKIITVLGVEAEKKLSLVLLSNNIITSRIRDMSEDILQQIIADVKASATDTLTAAVFLAVRYNFTSNSFQI